LLRWTDNRISGLGRTTNWTPQGTRGFGLMDIRYVPREVASRRESLIQRLGLRKSIIPCLLLRRELQCLLTLGLAMWLKIIAFVYAFCFSVGLFDTTFYETPFRAIGFVLGFGGFIGLFLFAFKRRFLSHRFWRCFTVIYVGYALVALLLGAETVIAAHGFWGFVGVAVGSLVFQSPIVLSLWRLSFATIQPDPARFGETAVL